MSYTNTTAALQFPSHYAPITEDEMAYVDGGYSFLCNEYYGWHTISRQAMANNIDTVVDVTCFIVAGLSVYASVKTALKKVSMAVLSEKIRQCLRTIGIACGIADIVIKDNTNWTVGYLIAYNADKRDGSLDGTVNWYGWGR